MADDTTEGGVGLLRAGLRDFSLGLSFEFTAPSLGDLWRFREELETRYARTQAVGLHADVIAASHTALLNARRDKTPLSSLAARDLRWVPFALFYPTASPSEWLANDERLVKEYLRWIEAGRHTRAVARMLRAYVMNFEPSLTTHELLRSGVRKLLRSFDTPRVAERKAWAEQHQVLELDAPRAFTRDWLHSQPTLHERVARFGRDGELALSRFMRAVEAVVCADVSSAGTTLTELQFIDATNGLSMSAPGGRPRFRDPNTGTTFANVVLEAFASSGRPPERLRTAVRQSLVDRLGDPRLPSHSAAWAGVSARAKQVFRRWLVDDTLRVFFEVISDALQGSPEKKAQWEARRRFWTAYLDDITDAWVALSSSARRLTMKNAAFRDLPHGRMEGAADNAVLIMTIDDLHLVEFAHVGGVRYWPVSRHRFDDEGAAPELFKDSYKMTDFKVNEHFNVPHHEGWEARVRTVIRNETGVRGNR